MMKRKQACFTLLRRTMWNRWQIWLYLTGKHSMDSTLLARTVLEVLPPAGNQVRFLNIKSTPNVDAKLSKMRFRSNRDGKLFQTFTSITTQSMVNICSSLWNTLHGLNITWFILTCVDRNTWSRFWPRLRLGSQNGYNLLFCPHKQKHNPGFNAVGPQHCEYGNADGLWM